MTDPTEPLIAETRSESSLAQKSVVSSAGRVSEDARLGPAIQLIDVAFTAGACRIQGVSIRLASGQTAALSGPVGAGKTTLLRVVAGVHPVDHGTVMIGDADAIALPAENRNLAWVPQGGGLLPSLTVRQQIEFPLAARGLPLDQAADSAERWGVTKLLDRRPDTLSGGERQLVALARATVTTTTGLLLDEPYSALSKPQTDHAIERLSQWRSINGAPWVIHATHQLETVSDRNVTWQIEGNSLRTL